MASQRFYSARVDLYKCCSSHFDSNICSVGRQASQMVDVASFPSFVSVESITIGFIFKILSITKGFWPKTTWHEWEIWKKVSFCTAKRTKGILIHNRFNCSSDLSWGPKNPDYHWSKHHIWRQEIRL